jgi:nitroreductase
MELDEAIKGRRSIRNFTDKPIPIEMIREVLEAGTWAPSAKNGQQWRFTVLTGEAKRKLTDLFRSKLESRSRSVAFSEMGSSLASCGIMERAPVLIVVWNSGLNGWPSEEYSIAAAVQNMLLKAHSLGLGSLWIADVYYAEDELAEHLGKSWKLMAAVAMGWPAETPKPRSKLTVDEVAEFIS